MAAQEALLALAGEEAEVLALGLLRNRETVAGGDLAHLRLVQLGERGTQTIEYRRRQRREHVALVLVAVGGSCEQAAAAVVDDARVVAGDQGAGGEALGKIDHGGDPHLAVADDARVRRRTRAVAIEESADD